MDSTHEEPRNLAEELDLPEQLDDDEAAAPAGGPLRFARMTGSSIAGRDAAAWVTDFLNAAYYRRPVDERDVDDLRFAFCVLTTYWYRKAARSAAHHRPARVPPRVRRRALRHAGHGRGLLSRDALQRGSHGLHRRLVPGRLSRRRRAAAGGSRSRPPRSAPPTTRSAGSSSPSSAS